MQVSTTINESEEEMMKRLNIIPIGINDLPRSQFYNDETQLSTRFLPVPLTYDDRETWGTTQLQAIGATSSNYLVQKTIEARSTPKDSLTSQDYEAKTNWGQLCQFDRQVSLPETSLGIPTLNV